MSSPSRGKIPRPTVKRLSLYLRELETGADQDQQTISSKQLGDALGLTDAQVRKDLAYFGQFGHPGIGYRVSELTDRLRQLLRASAVRNHAPQESDQRPAVAGEERLERPPLASLELQHEPGVFVHVPLAHTPLLTSSNRWPSQKLRWSAADAGS